MQITKEKIREIVEDVFKESIENRKERNTSMSIRTQRQYDLFQKVFKEEVIRLSKESKDEQTK